MPSLYSYPVDLETRWVPVGKDHDPIQRQLPDGT